MEKGVKQKEEMLKFRPINERLAYCRVYAKPFKLCLHNVYTPTQKAVDFLVVILEAMRYIKALHVKKFNS